MITSIPELDARCAIQEAIVLDAAAAKIRRATGAPSAAAQILPLHRGFVVRPEPLPPAPAPRRFAVITTRPGEPPQERTAWATCSLEVVIETIKRLEREGTGRVRVEVRAL
jgi:hypothetical protein